MLNKVLKSTSANYLAQVVAESIRAGLAPNAILTFNGEAIFLAMMNFYCSRYGGGANNKTVFARVINSINYHDANRIPYIHCHGVLPIPGKAPREGYKANDKLVFLEEKYLQMANNPMSWQALTFIEKCIQSKMVFVGVSLTDANMRHWLGWIHSNKMQELEANGFDCGDATEHFWINKKPRTEVEKTWIEESVAHLGVRLVWIDQWNQVGKVLKKMLGL